MDTHMVCFFEHVDSHISVDNIFPYFPMMSPDRFLIFCWFNKMKKYGLPGPETSRNDGNLKFLMSYAMKSGFYEFDMKEKNPIKILNLLFK